MATVKQFVRIIEKVIRYGNRWSNPYVEAHTKTIVLIMETVRTIIQS